MPVFVISSDPKDDRVAALIKLCSRGEHQASVVTDLSAVPGANRRGINPDCVIAIPESKGSSASLEQALSFLQSGSLNAFVIYVADSIPAEVYKQILKTERGEWIEWKSLAQELPDLIDRLDVDSAPLEAGRVISLVPSKGGVGNTTLAIEIGFALSREKKKPNALAVVDLNFQGSTLADSLDLEPRLDVSEFIQRPERLDRQLIEVFASRHRSGIDIFSSPPLFVDLAPLSPQTLFSLLDGLGKSYGTIILDLPHQWFPWVDNIIQGSDVVVVVGGTTVPAVRQLASRVRHIEGCGIELERVGVVLNCCETNTFGRPRKRADIERTFRTPRLFYLPRDVRVATDAANTGRAMGEIAPRRPLSKGVREIAEWVKKAK